MNMRDFLRASAICGLMLAISGCGTSSGNLFGDNTGPDAQVAPVVAEGRDKTDTIWEIFGNADDPNVTVEVNKYLWQASLEVLNFLPIQSVDPFSGVIVTGYGTPPGGGRAYKATIYVTDPALDARSLKVSLESRGGAVPAETVRAVEDAILTRARQIRIRDANL